MNKRIFISKNASEIDPCRSKFEELGYNAVTHSFLSFIPVPFEVQRPFDVIFFSSVRSVMFFKAGESIPTHSLIACIGDKTAELLESMGHTVDFKGSQSGEPKVVAEEFNVWLEDKNVLFPISDRSLKSISSEISDDQKEDVVVYSTAVVGKKVDACDVYVFTSPSNVEGFFECNLVPVGARVVAWGKSTEKALVGKGVEVGGCLGKSGIGELVEFLQSS